MRYNACMSRASTQYEFSRMTGHCSKTGKPINPGDVYVAVLVERTEDDGFDRYDFSLEAWEEGVNLDRIFSFWKTKAPEREEKKKILLDDDVLLNLFDRLSEDESPARIAFRFVLGLILIRKKLLRFDHSEKRGDNSVWLVRRKGVPATLPAEELINPELDEEAIRKVSEQLSEILNGEV